MRNKAPRRSQRTGPRFSQAAFLGIGSPRHTILPGQSLALPSQQAAGIPTGLSLQLPLYQKANFLVHCGFGSRRAVVERLRLKMTDGASNGRPCRFLLRMSEVPGGTWDPGIFRPFRMQMAYFPTAVPTAMAQSRCCRGHQPLDGPLLQDGQRMRSCSIA